jgi:predicted ATPase
MEKLIVKNFGAIRNVEIDLKELTIFIGKTGTGKSTLAKLVSIFRSADFWVGDMEDAVFSRNLAYYQIDNFLEESSTFMEYQSEMGTFVYHEGKIERNFSEDMLRNLAKSVSNIEQEKMIRSIIEELVNRACNEVIYIPAERGVVSFLSLQYGEDLTNIIPDTLLNFIRHFNKVSSVVGELYIGLFDVTYQKGKENDKDYIILSNGKKFLLSESASGLQAVIPAMMIFEYYAQDERKKSYTFEEPELNLFPIAQKSLVELLAEKVLSNGHKVVITTHSPYIPASINNLLFASKIQQEYPNSKADLMEVSGLKSFISSSDIAVYYLSTEENEDYCESVIDDDTGMIPDNELDSASEEIIEVFDQLMGTYRELKRTTN